jgi:hypothetical protein
MQARLPKVRPSRTVALQRAALRFLPGLPGAHTSAAPTALPACQAQKAARPC